MIVLVATAIGNVGSVASALEHLGAEFVISADPLIIESAERIVLPGVGAFDAGMDALHARGLVDPILFAVRERQTPILGVCLGMQLLLQGSEEGARAGLGLLPGHVVRLGSGGAKVPHVGFAPVRFAFETRLGWGVPEGTAFYFTHSYALRVPMEGAVSGMCPYDGGFVASIECGPVHGVQFHPEKSQGAGLRLLANFIHGSEPA